MKQLLFNTCWLSWVLLITGAAQAQQTVWRCGPGGTTYSNEPCPGGRAVGVGDSRASNDVQAAREVAGRDRTLAKDMRQERLQREAEQRAQGSGVGGFSGAKPAPPVKADQAPVVAKSKAKAKGKTKSETKSESKSKTKRKPRPPEAAGTSTKAARASRRAPG